MQFTSLLSVALATISLTNAMALPNPAVDAVANVQDKAPKGPPVNGDLHHVSSSGFCNKLSDASKKKSCSADLAKCEKEKNEKEEDKCENKVKSKYTKTHN